MRKQTGFKKAAISLSITMATLLALSGCGNVDGGGTAESEKTNSTSESTGSDTTDSTSESAEDDTKSSGSYDLYIFNTKGENADAMDAAAAAFGQEKGVTVKVFSLGSGTNSDEALRTEMNSSNMPAIFSCMNAQALVEWTEGGFAMDLADAMNEEFKTLVSEIPDSFHLTDGQANYGIPYNVEGYGYIADTVMLADIFGEENVDAFLSAFQAATYDEFEQLVLEIDAFINDGGSKSITLNGETFTTTAEKEGRAEALTGVFSVAGSEKWTYGDHFVNIAIDAIFADSNAAANTTLDELEAGRGAFEAYAKALDLKTSHATTERGPELINATSNGYDPSVATFANGKALFLKQGNWAYENIKKANEEIADTLTFLPVKMPFEQSDITTDGLTVSHMQQSIPVFVPNYYCINKKVSDAEKALAEEFLVWLNTTEAGQKFIIEDMAFIPYNADPEVTSAGYSLGDSIISYINDDKTLTNAYAGAPVSWATDNFGQHMMENYINKAEWSDTAYSDIADYAISSWAEMAGL